MISGTAFGPNSIQLNPFKQNELAYPYLQDKCKRSDITNSMAISAVVRLSGSVFVSNTFKGNSSPNVFE